MDRKAINQIVDKALRDHMRRPPEPAKPERLIDIKEVARRYGVHPKTIFSYLRAGRIPRPRDLGGGRNKRLESDIDTHLRNLREA